MTDYIQAWQCAGCGRIEHERAIGKLSALLARTRERLLRFGCSTPREGQ